MAPGAGWGRSAGRRRLRLGLGLGLGLGLQLGPCTCDSAAATLVLRCPARCPHGPVPAAARPPRRLLWHQLCGWLLHLLRLDRGLPTAGDCGNGGSRRYPEGRGEGGSGVGRSCQLLRPAAGAALSPGRECCLPRRGQWQRRPGFLGISRASGT